MMKRMIVAGVLILALCAGTVTALAADEGRGRGLRECPRAMLFAEGQGCLREDRGIGFTDADGDGICDNRGDGQGRGRENGRGGRCGRRG